VIFSISDELKDFSDTAALISNLDLVISVDTSVVHLAGALAKPVWVLSPFIPDWRWLLDREDSPWYPLRAYFGKMTRAHGILSSPAFMLRCMTSFGITCRHALDHDSSWPIAAIAKNVA
jgi:hypothetical protein